MIKSFNYGKIPMSNAVDTGEGSEPLQEPVKNEEVNKPRQRPSPMAVRYRVDDEYNRKLKEQLQFGYFPQILKDISRLIGKGESPEADKVIAYVEDFLKRLAIASKQTPPEMDIYLSDMGGINTGIMTDPEKPVLIFGLGMVDKIIEYGFTEDHLAPILGHERFHYLRSRGWKGDNGRPEESIADIHGIMEAARAGYNPKGMGEFFKALMKEEEAERSRGADRPVVSLSEMLDEHPENEDRIRNSELALAALQLTKRTKEELTPIPEEILEAAKQCIHANNFERYKNQTQYADKTPVEKLKLIADYFVQEMNKKEGFKIEFDYKEGKDGRYERDKDGEIIKEVKKVENVADELLVAHRLYEAFIDLHILANEEGVKEAAIEHFKFFMALNPDEKHYYRHDLDRHYRWILDQFVSVMNPQDEHVDPRRHLGWGGGYSMSDDYNSRRGDQADLLPPEFSSLLKIRDSFWQTKTVKEAVDVIDAYNKKTEELSIYRRGMNVFSLYPERIGFPHRRTARDLLNEKGSFRFDWEDQLQMTLSAQGTQKQRDKITEFLKKHVKDDPRITGHKNKVERWASSYSIQFDEMHFDHQGNVIALDLTDEEKNEANRQLFKGKTAADLLVKLHTFHEERVKKEKDALRTVDWSAMDRDFWGFVEKYSEYLQPFYNISPTEYPFAEVFMRRLKNNVENDPQKWSDTYTLFLRGTHDPDAQYDDYYSDKKAAPVKEYSLPDIIFKYEEKYFGHATYGDNSDHTVRTERGALPEGHPLEKILDSYADNRDLELKGRLNKKTGLRSYHKGKPRKRPRAKQPVEIYLQADIKHPFVKALVDLDPALIRADRKANLLSHFQYHDEYAHSIEGYHKVSPRVVFNHASKNTVKSLLDYTHLLNSGETNKQPSYHWHRDAYFELIRQLRSLDKAKIEKRYPVSHLTLRYMTYDFADMFKDRDVGKRYTKELKYLIDRQVTRNTRIDFKESLPLKDLIKRFMEDHGSTSDQGYNTSYNIFFSRPHLEKRYLNHIKKRIMKLPLVKRRKHLEKLMGLQLKDPDYRDWAIDQWVQASLQEIGKDDGSSDYAAKAKHLIKQSVYQIDSSQGLLCITRLLNAIEAQRDVSLSTKDLLVKQYGKKFLDKDYTMRFVEAGIRTCGSNPVLRQAFLDYITEPLTRAGTQKFSKLLKAHGAHASEGATEFAKKFFDPEKGLTLSPIREVMVVDYLHQNFWDMPFELRTLYIDRILFPVRENSDQAFEKAVTFVLDKVLPMNRKFAPEAREALMIYLDECPAELRRTTFSAILATAEQAAKKGELRPGQVLSQVLTRTGAAGGQLLQAMHSYLSGMQIDDADFAQLRDDLKSSKVDFAKPLRWEIFERMDEVLPKEEIQKIKRVGELKGSGSTAYVVQCKKEEGDVALKMMRKDVVEIADLQFERYKKAFDVLASKHDMYKPLPSMVDSARLMIDISTDGLIGKQQIDYAKSEYDDLVIEIDGHEINFNVAPCLSAGAEYIETALIEGSHLNGLDNSDEKRRYSIGIETAEIYRLLKGRATDKDRHGGQQGLEQDTVGMFDVGQLSYDIKEKKVAEPTSAEKRAFGQLLGIVFNAAARGEDTVAAFTNAITQKEWGDAKNFLVNEQRSLLARSDVYAGLGSTEKERQETRMQIFQAVWNKGEIDQDIFKGVTETISLSTAYRLAVPLVNDNGAAQKPLDIKIKNKSSVKKAERVLDIATMARTIASSAFERISAFVEPRVRPYINHFKPRV